MPDYHLFYQNMHPFFDGSNVLRNMNLEGALQVVSGKLKDGQVLAAGFTNLQFKDQPSAIKMLGAVRNLDSRFEVPSMFATGGYGSPEYTAIFAHEKFSKDEHGRVMRVNQGKGSSLWKCVPRGEVDTWDLKCTTEEFERIAMSGDNYVGYFEARTRGLAYVCGKFGGQKMVVGFTHRISAEGRDKTYTALSDAMKLIWDKHPNYSGCPTIFGGDFTFAPAPADKPFHAAYACKPDAVSKAVPSDSAEADSEADKPKDDKAASGDRVPLATSANGGFAFWVANKEIANDNASVHAETGGPNLSQHSGISLRLPAEISLAEVKK